MSVMITRFRRRAAAAQAYARTGITLMNGHTDQPSELFTRALAERWDLAKRWLTLKRCDARRCSLR